MATFLLDALGKSLINRAAQPNLNDGDKIAWLKRKLLDPNVTARWQEREGTLETARGDFVKAIDLIENKIAINETVKFDDHSEAVKRVERAFDLLRSEHIDKLAKVIFNNDAQRTGYIIKKFDDAHRGFIDSWRDTAHMHFYCRLSALRMAFYCDVYRTLFVDKILRNLNINEYLLPIVPKLSKYIQQQSVKYHDEIRNFITEMMLLIDMLRIDAYLVPIVPIAPKLSKCIPQQSVKYYNEIKNFIIEMMILIEKDPTDLIIDQLKNAKNDKIKDLLSKWICSSTAKEARKQTEDDFEKWMTNVRVDCNSLRQPFDIVTKPTLLAISIIKQVYLNKFKKYNPFNVEVGYQFDMTDSWVPIKLARDKSDREKEEDERIGVVNVNAEESSDIERTDSFQLLAEELAKKHIVIVTGGPGAGKTVLTKKIAYDNALDDGKLCNYDIVLLAEFSSMRNTDGESIVIEMALNSLEKMINSTKWKNIAPNLVAFVRNHYGTCKTLVVLDGYDEAVGGQCKKLDEMLANDENEMLEYDLIVTRRPDRPIKRKKQISFVKVMPFNSMDKENYIVQHFANDNEIILDNDKKERIESVKAIIKKNTMYDEMAATPLLLAFICLVYGQLSDGTRVQLYETIVRWMLKRRLDRFPKLYANLPYADENVAIGQYSEMTPEMQEEFARDWMRLKPFKLFGYICCKTAAENKYQITKEDICNLGLNIQQIDIFVDIGILYRETARPIGKQITIYKFAHQTFQEYFAAIYALKWEEECKMKRIDYSIEQQSRIALSLDQPSFFIEILLNNRDDCRLIESAQQYLIEAKLIRFDIQSSIQNENWQQLEYVNKILEKCQKINKITICAHKMLIDKEIELELPNFNNNVSLWICDGIFKDNQSNMINIFVSADIAVDITFIGCQFLFNRLKAFAKYVDDYADRFNGISFILDNDTIIDNNESIKLPVDRYKNFCKELRILQSRSATETTVKSSNYAKISSIIRLFSGIETLLVEITQPKTDKTVGADAPLEQLSNLTKLSIMNENQSIGSRYWNFINRILRKCSILKLVSFILNKCTYDAPIELNFLSINANTIIVHIYDGIFYDNNQSNIISISGDVKSLQIIFENCQFTLSRLRKLAEFVNASSLLRDVSYSISNTIVESNSESKNVYFKYFLDELSIEQTTATTKSNMIKEYANIFEIIQIFSSCIKQLTLKLFQPSDDLQPINLQLPILSQLVVYVKTRNDDGSIGKPYWSYINQILQSCPIIKMSVEFYQHPIDAPIDLHFLSIENNINVEIRNGIFKDNQLNMINISVPADIAVDITFIGCQFPFNRLKTSAEYVDQNARRFKMISLILDNDAIIDNNESIMPFHFSL